MPNLHGNFSARTAKETIMNVPSNAWVALPASTQQGRMLVEIHNKGEQKLYYSFDNTAAVQNRMAISSGSFRIFPVQDNLTLYGRSSSGGIKTLVVEYK